MMVVVLSCVRLRVRNFFADSLFKRSGAGDQEQYRPGDQVVVTGLYENASTLNFYGAIFRCTVCMRPAATCGTARNFPDAPPSLRDRKLHSCEMWNGPHRVFLWTEQEDPSALKGLTELYRRAARRQDNLLEPAESAGFESNNR